MYRVRQILLTAGSNFRKWHRNPQIVLCFLLAFVCSFLLSDKVIQFAQSHNTVLQGLEPFIWTFGDAQSVMTISLLLLLLFADMPNLSNEVPYYMIRTDRFTWLAGQIVYLIGATVLLVFFILCSTVLLSIQYSYPANIWSKTAAVLGYSDIGRTIAIPAYVKVLELTSPYQCTLHIFFLMIGYAVTMASLILFLNLCKTNAGMIGGVIFTWFGVMLNPDIVAEWFGISLDNIRYANILCGWISPLNHATYYMHNFGYDNLPRLTTSYLFFAGVSLVVSIASFWKIRNYAFQFTGTVKQ